MTSQTIPRARRASPPLTADQLRSLITGSLTDRPEVITCHPVSTIYADRLALSVEDRAGQLWRVHVLTEARP